MLDGLLKSKFYTKCKANVKMIRTRVETIKKKKIAVQKFLKNDIAELLRNGLDMNAYGRAEGLLIEQNMTRCYELVENFCANISSNLSLIQKQRECPEECREAVATLIYAAARFADLPELRDLRSMFAERYGNSLQTHTNSEFMERLSPRTCTKEMKLQLLQDIAHEFSIEWDSKALEQKLFTPSNVLNQTEYGDEKYESRRRSKEDDSTVTDFSQEDRKTSQSSAGRVSDEDADIRRMRPFQGRIRPPPYLKPKPERSTAMEDQEEDPEKDRKPKPRSVRQRNNNNNFRRGPKAAEDEEDRVMDGLLMHYSNKKSHYEYSGESPGISGPPESAMPPGRAASMPVEATAFPPPAPERGHTRAASFQPDGHIHPNLPGDYDELAARIAALRGWK